MGEMMTHYIHYNIVTYQSAQWQFEMVFLDWVRVKCVTHATGKLSYSIQVSALILKYSKNVSNTGYMLQKDMLELKVNTKINV